MSLRDWLEYKLGDEFLSLCDGDTYIVKEAQCNIECKRCGDLIHIWEPYARGTWTYAKFHVACAKYGL